MLGILDGTKLPAEYWHMEMGQICMLGLYICMIYILGIIHFIIAI